MTSTRVGARPRSCLVQGAESVANSRPAYLSATQVRVWDLRRKAEAYCLPAHSALVSDVRWAPASGEALATCGFDGRARLWNARDWTLLADLEAHDGKAMALDFGPRKDDCSLVTAGYDRTFKMWQPSDGGLLAGYE